MASDRPFPPSTRRLALARAAGLTPASPILVGAIGCVGAVVALAIAGAAIATRVSAGLRSAIGAADGASIGDVLARADRAGVHAVDATGTFAAGGAGWPRVDATDLVSTIIALALPVLGAIAIAAVLAHLAQTRAVWIPRRRLPNAPVEDPQRGARGLLAIGNAAIIALVTVAWLYAMAPRLAALVSSALGHVGASANVVGGASANAAASAVGSAHAIGDGASVWSSGAVLVLSFLAAMAVAWVTLGAIAALVRFAAHARSLRMTPEEQRADQRLAGADPRWRARRDKLSRGESVRDAVAGASVLVLGDGVAVAVAWDPVRRPVPTRTASGRAAQATQLLGLARRHAIAVHRDAELATLLAMGDGPVPETHWARLAEIISATKSRR